MGDRKSEKLIFHDCQGLRLEKGSGDGGRHMLVSVKRVSVTVVIWLDFILVLLCPLHSP